MRIAYLSHINVRGTRAHVHNTLKTCEALAEAGADLRFISADTPPTETEWQEIRLRHALKTPFDRVFFGTIPFGDLTQPSRLGRLWAFLKLNFTFTTYIWKHRHEIDAVYYRFHLLLLPALVWRFLLRKPVFFESHYVYIYDRLPQALTHLAVRSANGVIAITHGLRHHYKLDDQHSIMAPCHASELDQVPSESLSELRTQLGLPQEAMIFCYTGSIGNTIQGISYEVETMVDILSSLPKHGISVIVGMREQKDADALMARAQEKGVIDRVLVKPWTDRMTVMKYLGAADILLMPRVGTAPGSSPSKMFDYIAMRKPIIAASTPAVDEILHDHENALLVDADKPEEWIQAVQNLVQDPALGKRLADKAAQDATTYTWQARGERILAFIRRFV